MRPIPNGGWRLVPRALLALATSLTIALTIPALASANTCNYLFHCYAIVEWNMPNSGEEVRGSFDELEAAYGYVYYSNFEFIDDEMWDAFSSTAWVEAGITWGEGTVHGGSEDDYFYARQYSESNYKAYVYPEGAPMHHKFGWYLDDPELNGKWCLTWEWDSKPDVCWAGFPKTSKLLESGMEDAANTAEGDADNGGGAYGWMQTMNGTWHKEWQSASTHAVPHVESPACIVAPVSGYAYGSVGFAIPGC
jgi:hypothetical protein